MEEFFKSRDIKFDKIGRTLYFGLEEVDYSVISDFDRYMEGLGFRLDAIIPPDVISPTYMREYVKGNEKVVLEYIEHGVPGKVLLFRLICGRLKSM